MQAAAVVVALDEVFDVRAQVIESATSVSRAGRSVETERATCAVKPKRVQPKRKLLSGEVKCRRAVNVFPVEEGSAVFVVSDVA